MPEKLEESIDIVPDDRLLSPRDLVHLLQVSKSTVRRLELSGQLPTALRIGRQCRWTPQVIRAWLSDDKRSSRNGEKPQQSSDMAHS